MIHPHDHDDVAAHRDAPNAGTTSTPTADLERLGWDPSLIADTLLRRHMDQVEDELELMKARLAGVHRVLEQVERISSVPTDYRLWERGLQQVESSYLSVSVHATELVGLVEWEQIGHVLERLHQLLKHVQDDMERLGTPLLYGWDERLRQLTASAATLVADLALQLAAHLEPDASAGPAVRKLEVMSRNVASGTGIAAGESAHLPNNQGLASRPTWSSIGRFPGASPPAAADGEVAVVPARTWPRGHVATCLLGLQLACDVWRRPPYPNQNLADLARPDDTVEVLVVSHD